MSDFYGSILLTGYLHYLADDFRYFLENFAIDQFQTWNPECRIPHVVASSADFYQDAVLPVAVELEKEFVSVTVENAGTVFDGISEAIVDICERQYPLKKMDILSNFLETQNHLRETPTIEEFGQFLKRRLLDRKLYFLN